MSASQWRRAMNSGAVVGDPAVAGGDRAVPGQVARGRRRAAGAAAARGAAPRRSRCAMSSCWRRCSSFRSSRRRSSPSRSPSQSLVLGLIALSLTFLGGYGGMISLAQMTVAGMAGYALAVLGTSSAAEISLGWPWWAAIPAALLICVLAATLIGWLSVRTEGIYTIMITLAIGVAFYYLVLQNYSVFNGFQGLREIYPPKVLRHRLARSGAVLLPVARLRAGRLWRRPLAGAGAVRHRPAGHPRQPAADERARLPRRRPPRRRLRARGADRRRSAASSSSGTTA